MLAIGRLRPGPERVLVEHYCERAAALALTLGFRAPDIVELAQSRAKRDVERKQEEARALLARGEAGTLVVFDEGGSAITSENFARHLAHWRDTSVPGVYFVVGGPDGLDGSLRDRARLVLSFGAMTLPHQLVRILVLEQVYRAMTILASHPYHRS